MTAVQPVRTGPASPAPGLQDIVSELTRLRDALRLFPGGWSGAAAIHREAAQVDSLLERLHRAARPTEMAAQSAMARLSSLIESGARPDAAMQMVLREAVARQFSPGTAGSDAPMPTAADRPRTTAPLKQPAAATPAVAAVAAPAPVQARPPVQPRAQPAPSGATADPLDRAALQALDEARRAASAIP